MGEIQLECTASVCKGMTCESDVTGRFSGFVTSRRKFIVRAQGRVSCYALSPFHWVCLSGYVKLLPHLQSVSGVI